MANTLQDKIRDALESGLNDAVDLIVEAVIDCGPEEVFSRETLDDWAEENGWTKEEE